MPFRQCICNRRKMGSEAPELIEFHITGFKKFHGVEDNPTEVLVGKLEEYMRIHEMPSGTQLGSCTVLETAGQGALAPLIQLLNTPHEGIERPLIMTTGDSQGVQLGRGLLSVPHKRIVWVSEYPALLSLICAAFDICHKF